MEIQSGKYMTKDEEVGNDPEKHITIKRRRIIDGITKYDDMMYECKWSTECIAFLYLCREMVWWLVDMKVHLFIELKEKKLREQQNESIYF